MKNILKSLAVIVAVASVAGGVTWAYFTSTATVTANTFSTGTLKIKVDGADSIVGFKIEKAKPGDCVEKQFTVMNYGQPWFAGPSNITAKSMRMTVQGADETLCNSLNFQVWGDRMSGTDWKNLYGVGSLTGAGAINLFNPFWAELVPGSSQGVKVKACLPETGNDQNALEGLTCNFDLAIEARSN